MSAARATTPSRRRLGAVVVALVGALTAGFLGAVPGTSGAFVATITDTGNVASTAADFGRKTDALPYRSSFADPANLATGETGAKGWQTYGGCWRSMVVHEFGMIADTCRTTDGHKAVTGMPDWTDYTLQADVKLDSGQQAGLLARVSDEREGLDAHTGYYAYFTHDAKLELGRMVSGSYSLLATVPVIGGIGYNNWYHLVVQVKGCTVTLAHSKVGASEANGTTSLTFDDGNCVPRRGKVGLRHFDSTAAWRFVTVTEGATASRETLPWNSPWSTGEAKGFTTYEGDWSAGPTTETYANRNPGKGDKSVETTRRWADSSLTGELKFTGTPQSYLDAGYNVRVRDPGNGTDQLAGYYGGISSTHLVLGRHDRGRWTEFVRTPLAAPVQSGEWQHLTVEMVGCRLTVTAQATAGGPATTASHLDEGCDTTPGGIGVRTLAIPATFRSAAVTPR